MKTISLGSTDHSTWHVSKLSTLVRTHVYVTHQRQCGIKQRCCPSVCLSHATPIAQKTVRFNSTPRLLLNTNRKPHTGSRTHRWAWPHGQQKWLKLTSSTNFKSKREPWLLIKVNRKSQAAYHLRGRWYHRILVSSSINNYNHNNITYRYTN